MTDRPAETRYRRVARVAERVLADRAVLQLVDSERTVELSGTGLCVWFGLDHEPTLDELTADLAELFGADPALVRADLVAALDGLEADGFVEVR